MHDDEAADAMETASALATEHGLPVGTVQVLQRSNALTLRLLPCDVVARVAPVERDTADLEVAVALGLGARDSPIVPLDPRLPRRAHRRRRWVVTFWVHSPPVGAAEPIDTAEALARLHSDMRALDIAAPHVVTRVQDAERLVADPRRSPALDDADRDLLATTLRGRWRDVVAHGAPEQLLHGEPHPGNVLATAGGTRFVDLETCCHGPVAFDLAHVRPAVAELYPGLVDHGLLATCRVLVLAMVAAWRCDVADDLPHGAAAREGLLAALRAGPPYPDLDDVMSTAG